MLEQGKNHMYAYQDLPLVVDVSHFYLFEASFSFLLNRNHTCRINRNGVNLKFFEISV